MKYFKILKTQILLITENYQINIIFSILYLWIKTSVSGQQKSFKLRSKLI